MTYETQAGEKHVVTIVGFDEIDPVNGKISWISPVAQALTKARVGDSVMLEILGGMEGLSILEALYPEP